MRVTEQIEALTTLATNPFRYLIAPRILAATLMLPILVLVSDIIGVMGGWLLSTAVLEYNSVGYLQRSMDFLETWDVVSGLIKAAIFGFILALMGCYQGFNSTGGAQGVGRATTNAVVSASILILAANYAVTSLVFTD
jgi:phospholipid/cholesterol/gamma-HCH transport system permease protein